MNIGEYIGMLRKEKELNMRQLSDLSGVSLSAISRIESGDRKIPRPLLLKALAPHLGVSYEHLLAKAGYIEKTIECKRYLDRQFSEDDDESLADVILRSKAIIDRDEELFNVMYKAAKKLSDDDLTISKAIISSFIEKVPNDEETALRTFVMMISKVRAKVN